MAVAAATSERVIQVSRHALERWRQRVIDGWADEKRDVERAAREAIPVPDYTPLPFNRDPFKVYYRHARKPDLYFVIDPRSGVEVIVTVIIPYETGRAMV